LATCTPRCGTAEICFIGIEIAGEVDIHSISSWASRRPGS
jgi:hypothetical protein